MIERMLITKNAKITVRSTLDIEHLDRPAVLCLHGGGFSGRYFNRAGFSLVDAAAAAGLGAVTLDRPGSGASHFVRRSEDVFTDNATEISEAIGQIWSMLKGKCSGIYLIGHSIGGAIALMLAAGPRDWPLVAVSVSGIGDRPGAVTDGLPPDASSGGPKIIPRFVLEHLFFAEGAASPAALDAMEAASCPPVAEELVSIFPIWMERVTSILAKIDTPVQYILGEHEKLWETGPDARDRIHSRLSRIDRKDIFIFPGVGHCIDFHPQCGRFHDRVLSFPLSA